MLWQVSVGRPPGRYPLPGRVRQAQRACVGSDRTAGIRSLSSLLGERRAILACWAATLSAPVLALGFAPRLAERPEAVGVAAGVVVALVGLDAALYAVRRPLGVAACFPCVAVSTAAMGLGWVLAVR
jgi:4-hydroxybenzoate polyprenyltransferase